MTFVDFGKLDRDYIASREAGDHSFTRADYRRLLIASLRWADRDADEHIDDLDVANGFDRERGI